MLNDDYLPVAIFAVVALAFPPIVYFLSRLFRPRNPTPLKETTYECGEAPIGEAQIQFTFTYYMFAIIFVVFDVVAAFLFLWALIFTDLSLFAKVAMMMFVAVTSVAVIYALKKEEAVKL